MGIELQIEDLMNRNEILEVELAKLQQVVAHLLLPDTSIDKALLFTASHAIPYTVFKTIKRLIEGYVLELADPITIDSQSLEIDVEWLGALNREARSNLMDLYIDGPMNGSSDVIETFNKVCVWMQGHDSTTVLESSHMDSLFAYVNKPPEKKKTIRGYGR